MNSAVNAAVNARLNAPLFFFHITRRMPNATKLASLASQAPWTVADGAQTVFQTPDASRLFSTPFPQGTSVPPSPFCGFEIPQTPAVFSYNSYAMFTASNPRNEGNAGSARRKISEKSRRDEVEGAHGGNDGDGGDDADGLDVLASVANQIDSADNAAVNTVNTTHKIGPKMGPKKRGRKQQNSQNEPTSITVHTPKFRRNTITKEVLTAIQNSKETLMQAAKRLGVSTTTITRTYRRLFRAPWKKKRPVQRLIAIPENDVDEVDADDDNRDDAFDDMNENNDQDDALNNDSQMQIANIIDDLRDSSPQVQQSPDASIHVEQGDLQNLLHTSFSNNMDPRTPGYELVESTFKSPKSIS